MRSRKAERSPAPPAEWPKDRGGQSAAREKLPPLLLVLAGVASLLVLVIIAGTVYGFATGSRDKASARARSGAAVPGGPSLDLGQIRVNLKGGGLAAAKIAFPYRADEREFHEELITKKKALRAAAAAYFSARTIEELHPAYEGSVKAGLRDSLNALLSLGAIEEVWLSDLAVIP